jgi:gamma-glutamylcyclotransferase
MMGAAHGHEGGLVAPALDSCRADDATMRRGRARPRDTKTVMLVFAYASNLDAAQMRARCPSAHAAGPARLEGHALAFGGFSARWGGAVASVVRARGRAVEGLLYALTVADLEALDRFEGAPWVYERRTRVVTGEGGARRRAFVYALRPAAAEPGAPAPRYLEVVVRAYERLGFDPLPLVRAVAEREPVSLRGAHRTVFVYGTLLRGERNHRHLAGARFVGPARTLARYALYDLGAYPGMTDGDRPVEGELYEVGARHLDALDAFEGHPRHFRREPVALEAGIRAEGYLMTRAQVAGHPLVPSGSWQTRAEERRR